MTAYARRTFAGAGITTSLAAPMGATDLSFTLVAATNWPGGSPPNGNFGVVIDRGTTSEEHILCASNNGAAVTVATGGRGYDGTAATTHGATATVSLCLLAQDGDEANQAVVQLLGQSGAAAGDLPYVSGLSPTTYGRLAIGSANQILTSVGGVPVWRSLDSTAGDIGAETFGAGAAAGSVGKPADAGHVHQMPTWNSGSILTTTGDVYVYGASAPIRLPIGTDGFVLTARSTATNGLDWEGPPYALAYNSVVTNVLNASLTHITLGGLSAHRGFTVVGNNLVVPQAGLYQIDYQVTIGSAQLAEVQVQQNGSGALTYNGASLGGVGVLNGSGMLVCAASDTIGLWAQDNTTNQSTTTGAANTYLHAAYLGPS